MKKLISLLGVFGLLVTASSSVVSYKQETKQPKKNQLNDVFTQTDLDAIHIESNETSSRSKSFNQELKGAFNLSYYIVERLMNLNGNMQTRINPLELFVRTPTLINNYGDIRTIVEVLHTSKTHIDQVEVVFSVDIEIKFIITQTNLGNFYGTDEEKFELIDGISVMKDETLFTEIIHLNPQLIQPCFKNKLKRKPLIQHCNQATQTGQVGLILKGYQGSVKITYTAYTEIRNLVKNTNLKIILID